MAKLPGGAQKSMSELDPGDYLMRTNDGTCRQIRIVITVNGQKWWGYYGEAQLWLACVDDSRDSTFTRLI